MDSLLRRFHSASSSGVGSWMTAVIAPAAASLSRTVSRPAVALALVGPATGDIELAARAGAFRTGAGRVHCHRNRATSATSAPMNLITSPLVGEAATRRLSPSPTGIHSGAEAGAGTASSGNQRRTSFPSTSVSRLSPRAVSCAFGVNSPALTTIAPVAPCVHITPRSSCPTLWVTCNTFSRLHWTTMYSDPRRSLRSMPPSKCAPPCPTLSTS